MQRWWFDVDDGDAAVDDEIVGFADKNVNKDEIVIYDSLVNNILLNNSYYSALTTTVRYVEQEVTDVTTEMVAISTEQTSAEDNEETSGQKSGPGKIRTIS